MVGIELVGWATVGEQAPAAASRPPSQAARGGAPPPQIQILALPCCNLIAPVSPSSHSCATAHPNGFPNDKTGSVFTAIV